MTFSNLWKSPGKERKKEPKKERKLRKGRLVESAAAEEINKVACGDIFLMISTSCLEACWLPHLPQARRLLI